MTKRERSPAAVIRDHWFEWRFPPWRRGVGIPTPVGWVEARTDHREEDDIPRREFFDAHEWNDQAAAIRADVVERKRLFQLVRLPEQSPAGRRRSFRRFVEGASTATWNYAGAVEKRTRPRERHIRDQMDKLARHAEALECTLQATLDDLTLFRSLTTEAGEKGADESPWKLLIPRQTGHAGRGRVRVFHAMDRIRDVRVWAEAVAAAQDPIRGTPTRSAERTARDELAAVWQSLTGREPGIRVVDPIDGREKPSAFVELCRGVFNPAQIILEPYNQPFAFGRDRKDGQ